MKKLIVSAMVLASLTIVGVPAAMANGYSVFSQCPVKTANVNGCIYAPTESGYITIGNDEVPIEKTQVLQGGLLRSEEAFVKQMAPALNGETLVKTPQKVPGGLLGIKCKEITGEGQHEKELRQKCEKTYEEGILGVHATTELAAPASSVVFDTFSEATGLGPAEGYPPALALPVKVKLENVLLGNECYIGSTAEPIDLNLTTGATSGGPTGNPGTQSTSEEGGILTISGVSLVNNTFSAPGASGCGIFGLLDGIIDSKLGLPSASGKNVAVLNGKVEIANSALVEEAGY